MPATNLPRPDLILVNLGTPETPTAAHVRPFLREFLSDKRVIEMPSILWKPILEGIILRVRPKSSASKYATVWREGMASTHAGSPLMWGSLRQGELLAERLGDAATVHVAMRYGEPSLQTLLEQLTADTPHRRIAVLPLYPQYTASSAGTCIDVVARHLLSHRNQPEVRTCRSFADAPRYIEALAAPIEAHWAEHGRPDPARGEHLVLSFHSIPQAMVDGGDPYQRDCKATAAALGERLGVEPGLLRVTYQSVFGPAKWIGPATIDTVEALGKAGARRLDVICPGFMSDCLETLEEIHQLNRETYVAAGGQNFHYIQWGNDSSGAIDALEDEARVLLSGW